jgi:hypothetical protein
MVASRIEFRWEQRDALLRVVSDWLRLTLHEPWLINI